MSDSISYRHNLWPGRLGRKLVTIWHSWTDKICYWRLWTNQKTIFGIRFSFLTFHSLKIKFWRHFKECLKSNMRSHATKSIIFLRNKSRRMANNVYRVSMSLYATTFSNCRKLNILTFTWYDWYGMWSIKVVNLFALSFGKKIQKTKKVWVFRKKLIFYYILFCWGMVMLDLWQPLSCHFILMSKYKKK